ncbi:hypothetical protein [Aristophania vespae]|uniref:hypothetical protein n=1 Tax=Aristophania vespae TaxID=2697033 RepID=UPI002351311D|nr:hypothetical protein [Aristophania vespae]UMM63906.1 hypothetical protein DM15PD_08860 [Aristophania vespae]
MSNRIWIWQLLAGLLAGLCIALGVMALCGLIWGSTGEPRSLSAQILMWSSVFIWLICLNLTFICATAQRSWFILGGCAVVIWAITLFLKVSLS